MKQAFSVLIVFIVLYYLKVPVVVSFIDQLRVAIVPIWDQVIDSWIHLMERHPYLYMSLPVMLVYLMRKGD